PGVPNTYVFPALSYAMALLFRITTLDILYVAFNLTGFSFLMAMTALTAFVRSVVQDMRAAWLSVALVLTIVVLDPQSFVGQLGIVLATPNRYGFAPGILVAGCLYLI